MSSETTYRDYVELAKQRRALQQGLFRGYERAQRPPEDTELTHVGPGTPCGEYFRRFWIPVVMTQELTDLPKRIRILGEDLVAFRDGMLCFVEVRARSESVELDPVYKAYGTDSTEEYMRHNGIGVIHGGENSLRFTPHFEVTSAEVELIVEQVRDALVNGPKEPVA